MIKKKNTLDHPKNKEIIAAKWVYKMKFNSNDTIHNHKARLITKGYM